MLALAGGVKDGAFLGNVEVRRRFVSDNDVRNVIESVDLTGDGGYEPQAADELRINYLPGWRERETAINSVKLSFPVNMSSRQAKRSHHSLSAQADLREKHL